jgi:hypothetical protein
MRKFGAFLVLGSSIVLGQATNSADVTGSVTDAKGAVIPGATVVITDLDKGIVRTIINQSGTYDTGPIILEDH